MRRVVADCSVLTKLFIPEVASDTSVAWFAKWRKREIEVWIPELTILEFANVMWHKVRRKEISFQVARLCLADFLRLPLRVAGHKDLADRALRLAMELGITAYDASYVALTHLLKAIFVTADAKLTSKLKGSLVAFELIQ